MKGLYIKHKSRRRVNVRYRDFIALNALDRLIIKQKVKNITFLVEYLQKAMIANSRNRFIPKVRKILFASIFREYIGYIKQIIAYIPELPSEIEQEEYMNFERMEAHLLKHGLAWSERFRFQSIDQLRRFRDAFQFPNGRIKICEKKGYRMMAEEIILISLSRLEYPHKWSDLNERFPGRKTHHLKSAFY